LHADYPFSKLRVLFDRRAPESRLPPKYTWTVSALMTGSVGMRDGVQYTLQLVNDRLENA